jgi:hypothetical protein
VSEKEKRTLIKWRGQGSIGPGVRQCNIFGTIVEDLREITTIPKGLVDGESHHVVKSVVDVNPTAERHAISTCIVPLSPGYSHKVLIPF